MKFKDLKVGMFLENKHMPKSSPNRYHEIIGIKENADGGKPYTDMWGGNVCETPKYTLIFQNMNGKLTHFCFYSLEEDFDECIYKVIQNQPMEKKYTYNLYEGEKKIGEFNREIDVLKYVHQHCSYSFDMALRMGLYKVIITNDMDDTTIQLYPYCEKPKQEKKYDEYGYLIH